MVIKQDLISATRYWIKAPYAMTPYGICVHNTDNDAPAKNEIAYMKRNDNSTSFHIAVDDKEAIQAIPFNRNAWHAGDGRNGEGNRKYIAVEICYSLSGGARFIKAEKNAAEVIAQLLKDRGWGVDRVKRHYDFSGKNCPARTMAMGWGRFLNMVTENMKGVHMLEENNDPDVYLLARARVSKAPGLIERIHKDGFACKPVDSDPDMLISIRVRTSKVDALQKKVQGMGFACSRLDLA
jgi:N-acetylmuramoyl-L-alanine amidase CwlA